MAQRPPEFPSEPIASRRRGTSYFAVWATLACLSALYLAAVSVRPAFLEAILPTSNAEVEAQQAADIAGIHDNVGQLRDDVAKVQASLTEQSEHTRSLADRIAALERGQPADAAAPTATEAAPQASAAQPATSEFPETGHSGTEPKVINSPLETGSLQPDEAAPAPARKPAAEKPAAEKAAAAAPAKPKKPVGIRLATGGSVDNLRVSWGVLSERHGEELKALQPRYYNSVDGNGITYELVAGPFKSTAEAKKVCQSLKAQAIDCQVANYGGNAL